MLMTNTDTLVQERQKNTNYFRKQHHPSMRGKGKATTATRTSLLHKTQSWDLKVNRGGGLQVVQTTSRLDPLLAYGPMGRQGDKCQDLLHDSGKGGRRGPG